MVIGAIESDGGSVVDIESPVDTLGAGTSAPGRVDSTVAKGNSAPSDRVRVHHEEVAGVQGVEFAEGRRYR